MNGLIGEMRSAHARGDKREFERLVLEARGGQQFEDVLRYARGLDADVLSPDRLVQWSVVTDSHGCTDRYKGVLTVCGVEIDVPDMSEMTRRWAIRPGWYVLDLWECDKWVRSDAGVPHRDAPRRCLETVDAHLRGEASADAVRRAQADADAAASASFATHTRANAAAYAVYATVYAASAAAYTVVAASSSYAAATYAVFVYTADADAIAEGREMWHEDWRWHVVWHALKEMS